MIVICFSVEYIIICRIDIGNWPLKTAVCQSIRMEVLSHCTDLMPTCRKIQFLMIALLKKEDFYVTLTIDHQNKRRSSLSLFRP